MTSNVRTLRAATKRATSERAVVAVFFVITAIIYLLAWLAPAIGLYREDGVNLVTAKALAAGHGYVVDSLPHPLPQTQLPPFFPALLALFTLVSGQAQWLKLLPLLCAAGWLAVTYRLLLKMGASRNSALVLVCLTAGSPMAVFLATNLLPEMLFGLLVTAGLLMLLEDRPYAAGAFAGLATLTLTAGVTLIVACILTLAVRRRFRSAIRFTGVAMLLAAPWFGWSLSRAPHLVSRSIYLGAARDVSSNIVTGLPANEKVVVLTHNMGLLFSSPIAVLTGYDNLYTVMGTVVVFLWCLYVRRQLLPDLFLALYCLMLLGRVAYPERLAASVLPLVLWILWRVLSQVRSQEALAAGVLIVAGAGLWTDVSHLAGRGPLLREGAVWSADAQPPNDWGELQKLFRYIRAGTPAGSVLLGNQDPMLYLNTGRKAVRGFVENAFGLLYAAKQQGVSPEELSSAILHDRVDYVVLTPDTGFAESPSFHAAAQALERGGLLQPVPIAGISPEYRLLRVR